MLCCSSTNNGGILETQVCLWWAKQPVGANVYHFRVSAPPVVICMLKAHNHRLIKTQIGHARDFAWYRGQRPSPARVILSHERVQIHTRENLCSYATNPPHFRVRELLLCDILITHAGDGRLPRYQAKSLACPGCAHNTFEKTQACRMVMWWFCVWHQPASN